jgi:hypothetical protein
VIQILRPPRDHRNVRQHFILDFFAPHWHAKFWKHEDARILLEKEAIDCRTANYRFKLSQREWAVVIRTRRMTTRCQHDDRLATDHC